MMDKHLHKKFLIMEKVDDFMHMIMKEPPNGQKLMILEKYEERDFKISLIGHVYFIMNENKALTGHVYFIMNANKDLDTPTPQISMYFFTEALPFFENSRPPPVEKQQENASTKVRSRDSNPAP